MVEQALTSPVAADAEQGQNTPTQGTYLVADVRAISLVNWAVY